MSNKCNFFVGLDLGKLSDWSALMVIEQISKFPPGRIPDPEIYTKENHYAIRAIKRWQGMTYPALVQEVRSLMNRPQLKNATLIVDATGVGVAVADMFRMTDIGTRMVPVTITAGNVVTKKGFGYNVAKRILAGILQNVISSHRVEMVSVPESKNLLKELRAFKIKVSAETGNESFEAWRERDHDDCVLAVALALWYAEMSAPRQKTSFRILGSVSQKNKGLKIIVASKKELEEVIIDDRDALLVSLVDPLSIGEPLPKHGLTKLIDSIQVTTPDLEPNQFKDSWDSVVPKYDIKPAELMFSPEQGKKLWAFILKKREKNPTAIVIVDDGDNRSLSIAYAVSDSLMFNRKPIYKMGQEESENHQEKKPPNLHIYTTMKSARNLVL